MNNRMVIIFGLGIILQRYISLINMGMIAAFSDNDPEKQCALFQGKPVIRPCEIKEYEYEYVVIFTKDPASQIYRQLTSGLGITEDKIISWQFFLEKQINGRRVFSLESIQQVLVIIKDMALKNILDIQLIFERASVFTFNFGGEYCLDNMHIDGYCEVGYQFPIFNNIYENIHTDLCECKNGKYDVLLFIDFFMENTLEKCVTLIEKTYYLSRYAIITIPHPSFTKYAEWQDYDFSNLGSVYVINYPSCYTILIDKLHRKNSGNLRIYVAAHRHFSPPSDLIYMPIHAGKKGMEYFGFLGDDSGDNISGLNPLLNECTVLYWMWKHAACEYIGLSHYRRYLLCNSVVLEQQNILDEHTIINILKQYDFIVANSFFSYPCSVSEHLRSTVCDEAYRTGMGVVQEIIATRHTDYLNAFFQLFSGYAFFPCNLFVTRKKIMDQYCEWLFDIIIEAAERIDVSQYDPYSKRIIGFIAERLFTVWLMKQNLKIKELPILITE